jgi:hypothetical protein
MTTKDEALKMAIEAMEDLCEAFMLGADWRGVGVYDGTVDALQACNEALETPECNPHPKAPHGFNRNASHSAGRYVCECEGWQLEWQGLSNDRIREIGDNCLENNNKLFNWIDFARAIEQALKEKNNAV